MKFLFIVQGEGRGHLTQALTLEDYLQQEGHEVVKVLVGKSQSRELPDFFKRRLKAPIERFESPNFLPTPANKRNNITKSIIYNILRTPTYLKSIKHIKKEIESSGADIVVNFYEMLTGVTYLLHKPKVPFICIGHQYLFLHKKFKFPKVNRTQLLLLKFFTRITAIGSYKMLALSFRRMNHDEKQHLYVVPPLLRKEALAQPTSNGNYIHGYMVNAGFSSQVKEWHQKRPDIDLHFFWDQKGEKTIRHIDRTLSFHPLDDQAFLQEMGGCKAYASTAGFESICEALYMGKPILMVPAHIEQECNAYDAYLSGAGIISQEFQLDELLDFSRSYQPNAKFIFWTNSAPQQIVRHLESPVTNNHTPIEWVLQFPVSLGSTIDFNLLYSDVRGLTVGYYRILRRRIRHYLPNI